MPAVQIVIDVAGESAGSPGASRTFPYSKVASGAVTVSLSLSNTTEVDDFFWEIIDQPPSSAAVLSSSSAEEPTFQLPAVSSGTYLIRCTINMGQSSATNAIAITTANHALRKIAAQESLEFDPIRGWVAAWNNAIDTVDSGLAGGLTTAMYATGSVTSIEVASSGTAVGSIYVGIESGIVSSLVAVVQTGSSDNVDVELGDATFAGSPDVFYQIGPTIWDPDSNGNWTDRNAFGFVGLTGGVIYYRFTNGGANTITMSLALEIIGKE